MKAGKLFIDNQPYHQKLTVPQPKDILGLSMDELNSILDVEVTRGETYNKDGSSFLGVTARVQSIDKVSRYYVQMKLIYPEARHIICAFKLAGEDIHNTEGYCDYKETNAGRTLLRELKNCNILNRVVFVMRQYGGIKMGPERYDYILKAARQALTLDGEIVIEEEQGQSSLLTQPQPESSQEEDENNFVHPKRHNMRKKYHKRPSLSQVRGGRSTYASRLRGSAHGGSAHGASTSRLQTSNRKSYGFTAPPSVLNNDEWPSIASKPLPHRNTQHSWESKKNQPN